jgi:hypothetical protein
MSVGNVNSNERGSGARYNDGKPALDLVPLRLLAKSYIRDKGLRADEIAVAYALEELGFFQERRGDVDRLFNAIQLADHDGEAWNECARVYEYGKRKYAAWNWAKGMNWSVPLACAGRHALAILRGEKTDAESGLPHRGHFMCNLVMLLTFLETYPEGDDRMPASIFNPTPAAEPLPVDAPVCTCSGAGACFNCR